MHTYNNQFTGSVALSSIEAEYDILGHMQDHNIALKVSKKA